MNPKTVLRHAGRTRQGCGWILACPRNLTGNVCVRPRAIPDDRCVRNRQECVRNFRAERLVHCPGRMRRVLDCEFGSPTTTFVMRLDLANRGLHAGNRTDPFRLVTACSRG